jgi:peptidyl-prolyl cis-trans isomerase D
MMTFLRKHRGWLMIVITILALPFCLYFVKTDYSRMRSDAVATVYGRTVTNTEFQRNGRLYFVAQALGMDTLTQSFGGSSGDEAKQAAVAFALTLPVLQHEADQLGIAPTDAEKAEFIKNLRGLRSSNGFDPQKYREFSENILPANGFSDAQIEELAAYALSLNRMKDLVTIGVAVPEAESKSDYDLRNGRLFVQAIRVRNSDFAKEVKVSDDEVKKYYEQHAAEFKTEEKRKVEFVALALTDEQKKLQGKERIDVLQKLADRANEITQSLGEKSADFHQVAAKFQLPVKATAEFTQAAPDPQFKADQQLTTVAFQLNAQEPNSDAVQTSDGFYVLHLAGVTEARPLAFEEAKGKIVDLLKNNRMREMAMNKGRSAVQELRTTLKSGAPLKVALEKANLKAEPVPPFTLAEAFDPAAAEETKKGRPKDFNNIAMAASQTQPGEIGDFMPSEDGGLMVLVEKREPPDPKKYEAERAAFDEKLLRTKRDIVFNEWLHDAQRDAGLFAAKEEASPPAARAGAAPQRPSGPPAPPKKS